MTPWWHTVLFGLALGVLIALPGLIIEIWRALHG